MSKTVLITGCGPEGIGEALCREFLDKGYQVIATVLPEEPRKTLELLHVQTIELDLLDKKSISDMVTRVKEITGESLDVLVNNAGIEYTMPAVDMDMGIVGKVFAINVIGPMQLVQEFHPLLIKAKGTVVNISSITCALPWVYSAAYNASKAALTQYGNTLRIELEPFGVRVINIISGEVGTNILRSSVKNVLPEGSAYAPLRVDFESHVKRIPETMPREKYAKRVVQEVVKKSPSSSFWYGNSSFLIWFLNTFGWSTVWDPILKRMFRLKKLESGQKSWFW